jgi:hypothetical protein
MKELPIYLNTSVVNFLFAEDAPDFRRVTEDFFAVHAWKLEGYWLSPPSAREQRLI